MSKRLIIITNDSGLGAGRRQGNYHEWMYKINEVLDKENARIVNITKNSDDYKGATAFIEITEPTPKKKRKPRTSVLVGS